MNNVCSDIVSIGPKDLVSGTVQLASLPDIYCRVQNMMARPLYTTKDIGKIISTDPGLSTRLLKIVNSPFYGASKQIDTITRAITIIGHKELTSLILATSVVKVFKGLPNKLINMESFWKHSTYCGTLARVIATQLKKTNTESYFVAGLLHDIGSLVIYHKIPDLANEAFFLSKFTDTPIEVAERGAMNFTHADIGAELLRAWNIPANIIEGVEFHHTPDKAKKHKDYAQILFLANSIANSIEDGRSHSGFYPPLNDSIWKQLGLYKDLLEPIVTEANLQMAEIQQHICNDTAQAA